MIRIPDQIKQLFTTDNVRKNFRVIFPNGEFPDMVNDKIENESVMLTESISSQSVIQFGLCESPMIEFVCHEMPNFTRKTIKCQLEVDISSLDAEDIAQYGQTSPDVPYPYYVIPYGTYIVKECKKSGDSDKRKVVGYSKLTYQNWDFPIDAFSMLKGYGWNTSEPDLSINFEDILMLYSPSLVPEPLNNATSEYSERSSAGGNIKLANSNIYLLTNGCSRPFFVKYKYYTTTPNSIYTRQIIRIKSDYNKRAFDDVIKQLNEYINEMGYGGYISFSNEYHGEPFISKTGDETGPFWHYTYLENKLLAEPMTSTSIYEDLKDWDEAQHRTVEILKKDDISFIFPSRVDRWQESITDGYKEYDRNTGGNTILVAIPYAIGFSENMIDLPTSLYYARHSINSDKPFVTFTMQSSTKTYTQAKCVWTEGSDERWTYTDVSRTVYTYTRSLNDYYNNLALKDINYKDLIQSMLELQGKFGMIDRTTGDLKIIDLTDHLMLYPSPDLYPSQDLYPRGSELLITRSMYKLVEYEDSATRHYDRISCTWTDASNNEHYQYYDIVDHDAPDYDPDDYQTYSLSENYFIKNKYYTVAQVTEILQTLGEKIKGFQYFPCDIECVGLPYVETGDGISVVTKDSGFTSFVLRRTIKGIQSLEDNIEAR